MSAPTILPAPITPNLRRSPVRPIFGAICARCDGEYTTSKWFPPFNRLCPTCITGQVEAQGQVDTSFGAGS